MYNGSIGLTETFTTVATSPNDKKIATPGSAGVLIPGIVARVVKPDGSLAKEGEPGELVVTGPSMALGYYKNPEAYVLLPHNVADAHIVDISIGPRRPLSTGNLHHNVLIASDADTWLVSDGCEQAMRSS